MLMRTGNIVVLTGLLLLCLCSCKKETRAHSSEIPEAVKKKVFALGFSAENIRKTEKGYLVEGDIVLSEASLDQPSRSQFLSIAGNEQYRTSNLITALPKVITISLSSRFPSVYGTALDEAISRYNTESLQVHFQRTSGSADINMVNGFGNYAASSGLPSPDGTPYETIRLNAAFIGYAADRPFIDYLATLMTHEIGHCIGFRHTDYADRSFSCTGRPVNEGAGSSGAVYISGTPAGADAASWMLACIQPGQNRPFTSNDRIALNYLY